MAFAITRAIRIYEPSGHARLVRAGENVELEFLPGFSAPASRFFEGV